MSTSLKALVNRYWEDKGEIGVLARITDLLYDELEHATSYRIDEQGFKTVQREIQTLILEGKKGIRVGKASLSNREKMKENIKGMDASGIGEQELGEF